MITVVQAGTQTTLQDMGRWGYQAWGMPVSGVLDPLAALIANQLVGNQSDAPLLEMVDEGCWLQFDESVLVAVTGADMQVRAGVQRQKNWSSFIVPAGCCLSAGKAEKGYRTYLAVHGGFRVNKVMDSCSTCIPAGIGGLAGRALLVGDMLEAVSVKNTVPKPLVLPKRWQPEYAEAALLHIVKGPQTEYFTTDCYRKFWQAEYQVKSASRSECSLQGTKLSLVTREPVSDASGWGAVEVPASGEPLLVLPDHGTTRGFPKIGYVMQADFSQLGQLRPGQTVQFKEVSAEAAAAYYYQQQDFLMNLYKYIDKGQK